METYTVPVAGAEAIATPNGNSGSGPVEVKTVNTDQGPMAFAVYRGPPDFVRDETDEKRASRPVGFRIERTPVVPGGR
jgi:hypothetical protein